MTHVLGHALTGVTKEHDGILTNYTKKRNRFNRWIVFPDSEERLQYLVPEKCRHAVFTLGHHAMLGGHIGLQKTLDSLTSIAQFMGREVGRMYVRGLVTMDV